MFAAKRRFAKSVTLSLGRKPQTRFIILTRSRTGSNHLSAMLNSHPNVLVQGEIFSRLEAKPWREIYDDWHAPKAFFIKASGFKIFYYHPMDADGTELWQTLLADRDLKVLHLKRRNKLETELSQKLATLTGTWLQKAGEKADEAPRIAIDPEKLEEAFERTSEYELTFEQKFQSHAAHEIYYEDLISDARGQFLKVCDFLEVRRRAPRSNLVKQRRAPVSELIENFDALKAHFRGSRWARFFDI
jgi:LPS sulfotransferase NodH